MHWPVPVVGSWLRRVLVGHYRYYGVPRNIKALMSFRYWLVWRWKRVLDRRSQRGRLRWDRMTRYAQRWLPMPRIYHPHPAQRLRVRT